MGSLRTELQAGADRLERWTERDRSHGSPASAAELQAAALDLVRLVRLLEPPDLARELVAHWRDLTRAPTSTTRAPGPRPSGEPIGVAVVILLPALLAVDRALAELESGVEVAPGGPAIPLRVARLRAELDRLLDADRVQVLGASS